MLFMGGTAVAAFREHRPDEGRYSSSRPTLGRMTFSVVGRPSTVGIGSGVCWRVKDGVLERQAPLGLCMVAVKRCKCSSPAPLAVLTFRV